MDLLPRPFDPIPSLKVKVGLLLLCSGGAGLCVLWFGLGMMPPKTTATAAVAAVVTSQVLAHGMTSPLRQMTDAAKAMARGDYSRRVRATARDEVGQLADAFNLMAADLAAADRQRREVIANVAHELRTPVSALRATLENLADGVSDATPAALAEAAAQTERLGTLVNQLLDVSRLDTGATALRWERFAMRPLIEDCLAAVPESAGRVTVAVPEALTVHADRERLRQVVGNLVVNAVKHGGRGATVRVSAWRDGVTVTIRVADTGPGIPPGERLRVFERFTRGQRATGAGTGLGLAIAKSAVESHGGAIRIADTPVGCAVEVVLPQSEDIDVEF
ncbi:HAMP domain-containing sensor histidine kinase [Stackebrandtia albiflava]|nr:HAMP domain-containing sensor histidine kinase [Stackebrandtia albiflava]